MNLLRIAVMTKDEDKFKKGEILFKKNWFSRDPDDTMHHTGHWLNVQNYATIVIDLNNCKGDETLKFFIDSVLHYRFGRPGIYPIFDIIVAEYQVGGLDWDDDDIVDDNLRHLINLYRHGQAKSDTITVPIAGVDTKLSREDGVKIYEYMKKELEK